MTTPAQGELAHLVRELGAIRQLLAFVCERAERAIDASAAAAPPAPIAPCAAAPVVDGEAREARAEAVDDGRKRSGPARRIDRDALIACHARGLTDAEIARELGCSPLSVRNLRIRSSIPANRTRPRDRGAPPAAAPLEAAPPPAAAPSEPERQKIFAAQTLVTYLRSRGTEVVEVQPGKLWKVNRRTTLNRAELLSLANSKRERQGLPPFEFF